MANAWTLPRVGRITGGPIRSSAEIPSVSVGENHRAGAEFSAAAIVVELRQRKRGRGAQDRLDAASRRELADTIADYQRGLVPLVVPLTLLRHYVRVFDVAYLAGQMYLQPHPKELMLRNHV